MYKTCVFYNSLSKIEKVKKCNYICGSNCSVVKRYKKLLSEGKVDLIYDLAKNRK